MTKYTKTDAFAEFIWKKLDSYFSHEMEGSEVGHGWNSEYSWRNGNASDNENRARNVIREAIREWNEDE